MNTSVYYLLMHICLLLDRRAIKKILASSHQRAYTTALGEIWAPLHSKGLHFQGYPRPAVQQKRKCEKNGAVKAVWE